MCYNVVTILKRRGIIMSTTKDSVIRIRVKPELKDNVTQIFDDLGLTISEGITLYLQQVYLNKGIPFPIRIPNNETIKAIEDARSGKNLTECSDITDLRSKLRL